MGIVVVKSNDINCVSETDEYIRCVHCQQSTGMLTAIISKFKGCTQFNCVSCNRVGTYRVGPFEGTTENFIKQEPIEMENWADHVTEEDFL